MVEEALVVRSATAIMPTVSLNSDLRPRLLDLHDVRFWSGSHTYRCFFDPSR